MLSNLILPMMIAILSWSNAAFSSPILLYADDCRMQMETEVYSKPVRFNDTTSIPAGLNLVSSFGEENLKFKFSAQSIALQKKSIRNLMKKLRFSSLPKGGQREHEVGALLVVNFDGTERTVLFSSDRIDVILPADMMKAIYASHIFEDLRDVKSITHFHTHPNLKNASRWNGRPPTALQFGLEDFLFYQELKQKFKSYSGREIPFDAVVIPNSDLNPDLFFHTIP